MELTRARFFDGSRGGLSLEAEPLQVEVANCGIAGVALSGNTKLT